MLTYQMPVGVAGLPAKERRDELEGLRDELAKKVKAEGRGK
jgi:hypothetical protein